MADLEVVCAGAHCQVAMLPKVTRAFEALDADRRGALIAVMRIFASKGGDGIPDTQFKFEDRLKTGGKRSKPIAIWAFKAWQVRVYGALLTVKGRSTFVCAEIDTAKKQNRGDRACMERAARTLEPYA